MVSHENLQLINRVPKIISLYWVIKIASTTLGETGADMFSMTYGLGYGSTILLFLGLFAVSVSVKIYLARYETSLYWLVFTFSAIAGTAVSDFLDRTLGLGYGYGSLLLTSLLIVILFFWYLSERSIKVETITTSRAEMFYWLAFLIANTLGTAAGDYVADDLQLGFALSAALFTGGLSLLLAAHFFTRVSAVFLFWLAFVLTRPFGATFGDFLTKPIDHGGLDLGTQGASFVFLAILLAAVFREYSKARLNLNKEGV